MITHKQAPPVPYPPTPLDVMLAEDDRDDRFFFATALRKQAFPTQLTVLEDGILLMSYFPDHPVYRPAIIFMDVNMPGKSGIECLCELKSDKRLKDIPVVMYSSIDRKEEINLLYRSGAHYYMNKSSFFQLSHCIRLIFELLQASSNPPARENFEICYTAERVN